MKAPVEAVWQAWTTSEGIKSFFAPDARVEARPDGPFEIYFNPYAPPGATLPVSGICVTIAWQQGRPIALRLTSEPVTERNGMRPKMRYRSCPVPRVYRSNPRMNSDPK